MHGTRYGDFSRFLEVRFDSVLMQQGRVQLDADWNAQAEATADRLRRAIADALGGSCGPAHAAGFEITPERSIVVRGDDPVELPGWDEVIGETGGEYTFELWLSWSQPGTAVDCGRREGANSGFVLSVDHTGVFECEVVCGAATPVLLRGDRPLARGERGYVAFVHTAEEVALYLDGAQIASGDVAPCSDSPEVIVLGGSRAGTGAGFAGRFSGVRVSRGTLPLTDLIAARDLPLDAAGADARAIAAWQPGGGDELLRDAAGGRTLTRSERAPLARHLAGLVIEPGRYYVDGVLCELRRRTRFHEQSERRSQRLPRHGRHLVYLETWQRTLDATIEPALREVVLGGVDTSVVEQTVSSVRCAPFRPRDGEAREDAIARVLRDATRPTTGRLRADHTGELAPGNYLYRVEIHRGGILGGERDDAPARVVELDREEGELVLSHEWAAETEAGTVVDVEGLGRDGERVAARHAIAAVRPDANGQRIRLADDPGDLAGLEDLTVRRYDRRPTFKWSRRNGAETFAIAKVEKHATSVRLLGRPTAYEPLARGDIVEVLDAGVPLDGPPHRLLEVRDVDLDGVVRLSGRVPPRIGREEADRPFLRRWDQGPQPDAGDADGAIPIAGDDDWIDLGESGLRVQFEHGRYARGDYWWIVARHELRTIEWPHEHGRPQALAPNGVGRRAAPLALLDLRGDDVEVRDLRRIYRPAHERPEPGDDQPEQERHHHHEEHHHHGGDERDPAFAVLAPAGEAPPRFTGSGVDVVTRAHWRRLGALDVARQEVQGIASVLGSVAIATADALWRFDGQEARRETDLPQRRHGYAFCALEELLVVLGGRTEGGRRDKGVHAYDLERGAWTELLRLPVALVGHAAVAAAGRVHVLGGHGRLLPRGRHYSYGRDDGWRRERRLPKRRAGLAAAHVGSHLHALGGDDWRGRPLRRHPRYDLGTGRWEDAAPLPVAHQVHGAAAHRGRCVALVGRRGHDRHVLVHHDALGRWDELPPLPPGVEPVALTAHGDTLVALGEDPAGALGVYEMRFPVDWEIFVPDPREPILAG